VPLLDQWGASIGPLHTSTKYNKDFGHSDLKQHIIGLGLS
jgi:hypothetical protein